MSNDHYSALGLDPKKRQTYSKTDLHAAFRGTVSRYPDAFTSTPDPAATAKVQRATQAWSVFKDDKQRAEYDAQFEHTTQARAHRYSSPPQYERPMSLDELFRQYQQIVREEIWLHNMIQLRAELKKDMEARVKEYKALKARAEAHGRTICEQRIQDYYNKENLFTAAVAVVVGSAVVGLVCMYAHALGYHLPSFSQAGNAMTQRISMIASKRPMVFSNLSGSFNAFVKKALD